MKKSLKILSFIILCVILSTTLVIPSFAAAPSTEIMPLWDNVNRISMGFGFGDGAGDVSARIIKYSHVTRIEGTIKLYWNNNGQWVYIDEVTNSSTSTLLIVNMSFPATEGVQYKAVLTVTAYSSSGNETITDECIDTY